MAFRQGDVSNDVTVALRFSIKMRSSSSLATPLRGPMRIQMRPLYLTGGKMDGSTFTIPNLTGFYDLSHLSELMNEFYKTK